MSSADNKKATASFVEKENEFAGTYGKEVFEILKWAYKPHWIACVFWVFIGWIARLMLMGNTLVVGTWIDSLSGNQKIPVFFRDWTGVQYFHFLTLLCCAGFLLTWISRVAFSRISVAAISTIYDEVTLRVSRYPIRFFDRTPVGRIVTRFSSDYGNMFRMFGGPLSEFFGIAFDLSASLILLVSAHWMGVVSYFILLALNLTVYLTNKQKIRSARREQSHNRSPGVAHFAETVQGASVIRVFAKSRIFFSRFTELDDKYAMSKYRAIDVNTRYATEMVACTYGVAFASGATGLWFINKGLMTAGELASIIVLLNLAGASFQMLFDWMAQFEEAFVGVERMNEYLRLPMEAQATLPQTTSFPTGHPIASGRDQTQIITEPLSLSKKESIDLDFDNVWFRYADDLPWILKGIHFSIQKGEKIGIVGRTGAGKTTLFQVLQGFYPFQQGNLRLGGKTLSIQETRECLTVIPQEPVLFNASVRENLDLRGIHPDSKLLETLERVGLSTWIHRSSSPLDTIIEERGKNLSQGEKQLLVMARMSLVQRPLVLMDEATSSIDPLTEVALVRAMNHMFEGRTQLIIAHRLSTIESCDRVLWLKDGNVALFESPQIVLNHFQTHGHQNERGI